MKKTQFISHMIPDLQVDTRLYVDVVADVLGLCMSAQLFEVFDKFSLYDIESLESHSSTTCNVS